MSLNETLHVKADESGWVNIKMDGGEFETENKFYMEETFVNIWNTELSLIDDYKNVDEILNDIEKTRPYLEIAFDSTIIDEVLKAKNQGLKFDEISLDIWWSHTDMVSYFIKDCKENFDGVRLDYDTIQ